ncbi:MAG: TIGR02301 family protein [Amphiplicatus sp.]
MLKRFILAMFAAALTFAQGAGAQEINYAQRSRDLLALSRVFGELHHIRRACEAWGEEEVWRNRMRKLVELESPQPELRDQMVAAFNDGFRTAEQRFPYCDRAARDYAAASAAEGDAVTARLTAPLYDSLADSGETPAWRGSDVNQ